MLSRLRHVSERRDGLGYQSLIKAFISKGLETYDSKADIPVSSKEAISPCLPSSHAVFRQVLRAIDTPMIAKKRRRQKERVDFTDSKVILDDIRNLAKSLESYQEYFAGKTFLITGAFGFLGRYMVYLLKCLNEEILEKKTAALLLDNFVTGYEQSVLSDENLVFYRHDVVKPFKTDQPLDYIIHAAGIASPVYYTKFPIETLDVGTIGTRNMLDLAYQKKVKSFLMMS
ncbi:MAG: NAD-dependent epimerase/dehydratase family protein, partial [Candidatus Omnitrophica bacterium]|nr:NAD-dependent epimerase/dehydratase family protein [Candidatus Omnitrophota bacterium]